MVMAMVNMIVEVTVSCDIPRFANSQRNMQLALLTKPVKINELKGRLTPEYCSN